ncbi:MAG: class I SAM-dependent methyltransferase [Gammaproteobacteria bacterium]|nr:class I SAM-dependent methyltransferase [Gammaproteobacteria bacterium]
MGTPTFAMVSVPLTSVWQNSGMPTSDPLLPSSTVPGLIPTLNHTGWMTEGLDEISKSFVAYASSCGEECLDIGCAYGVATLPVLAAGGRVLAADIEPKHLEILRERVPVEQRSRLRTQVATMPDVKFPAASFGAILCARALHFLRGGDIGITVLRMFEWLKPGGRICLVADGPYTGPWYKHAAEYERRKAAGCPWPGYVEDYRSLLPASANPADHPSFINPLDPDILRRVVSAAGFEVLEARWLAGAMPKSPANTHAGVVGEKRR